MDTRKPEENTPDLSPEDSVLDGDVNNQADGQLAAVTSERDQLTAEKADLQDRLLRAKAEFENARRRAEREAALAMLGRRALAGGDLASLLAGGGIGDSGRAALAELRGTSVAAVALPDVGRRPHTAAIRGDSRQPVERVQSRPPESGGRTADRSMSGS